MNFENRKRQNRSVASSSENRLMIMANCFFCSFFFFFWINGSSPSTNNSSVILQFYVFANVTATFENGRCRAFAIIQLCRSIKITSACSLFSAQKNCNRFTWINDHFHRFIEIIPVFYIMIFKMALSKPYTNTIDQIPPETKQRWKPEWRCNWSGHLVYWNTMQPKPRAD